MQSFRQLLDSEVLIEMEPIGTPLHALLDVGVFVQRERFEQLAIFWVESVDLLHNNNSHFTK